MTVAELLTSDCIRLPLLAGDKEGALAEMADQLASTHGAAHRRDEILASLRSREGIMSTGIGRGVAIPHAELEQSIQPAVAVGISPTGIDFGAPDGKPVYVMFALAFGRELARERIQILSTLSRIFRKESVRDEIRAAATPEALIAIFAREEELVRRMGHANAATF